MVEKITNPSPEEENMLLSTGQKKKKRVDFNKFLDGSVDLGNMNAF